MGLGLWGLWVLGTRASCWRWWTTPGPSSYCPPEIFWQTSMGDHSETVLLYELFCGAPPSCLKVKGWVGFSFSPHLPRAMIKFLKKAVVGEQPSESDGCSLWALVTWDRDSKTCSFKSTLLYWKWSENQVKSEIETRHETHPDTQL